MDQLVFSWVIHPYSGYFHQISFTESVNYFVIFFICSYQYFTCIYIFYLISLKSYQISKRPPTRLLLLLIRNYTEGIVQFFFHIWKLQQLHIKIHDVSYLSPLQFPVKSFKSCKNNLYILLNKNKILWIMMIYMTS